MDFTQNRRADDFTCTCWSMVRGLAARQPEQARDALTELALRYWYPVYAYVRRCGHAPEIAQDIVRTFFARIAIDAGTPDGIPRGRFRDWLLSQLDLFLAGDWRDLSAGTLQATSPRLADLEQRNRDDHAAEESPEHAFRRRFALEVLARAFKSLQVEARQTGHLDMYEALEPYLSRDPLPRQYDAIGERLGIRPVALVLALKRLRQRFRELVHLELADAVTTREDMVAEQKALLDALGKGA